MAHSQRGSGKMQYYNLNSTIEIFLRKLYNPAKKYHQRKLKDIVFANNIKFGHGEMFGGIIYEGETFYYLGSFMKKHEVNCYLLHEDLITKMDAWIEDKEQIDQEEIKIRRFLGRFFSEVTNYYDAKELLGENIFQMLELESNSLGYSNETKLSEKEFKECSIAFQPYIQIIQDRIMDNLIARTLYDSAS
jgi:hypothetical protein